MTLSRRRFLQLVGRTALYAPFGGDWTAENPLTRTIRQNCERILGDLSMALDFRGIDGEQNERFRVQIRADQLMPVASCFKAFVVLYYYRSTPPTEWADDEFTPLYRMTVHSDNTATGVVLADIAARVPGDGNPIEKFNDFQRATLGITSGIHSWDWEGSPTVGYLDPRYAPSGERAVWVRGYSYPMDNVYTAADLARGYDFLTRGQHFTQDPALKRAIEATTRLLSIPGYEFYRSPIERAYSAGYMGKDGVLPTDLFPPGRVINDCGAIQIDDRTYILTFLSAGESEAVALDVVRQIVDQIDVYERGLAAGT